MSEHVSIEPCGLQAAGTSCFCLLVGCLRRLYICIKLLSGGMGFSQVQTQSMLCLCSSISRRAWINRNANGASAQGHMIRASPSHLKVKSRKTLHVKYNKKW